MKHREYIGGGDDSNFDLRGGVAFTVLLSCGAREHHRILDLGCGSLSLGKLLIPFLKDGHYYGIDPNKWLIDEGLKYEARSNRLAHFAYNDDFNCDQWDVKFDMIVALSVLSHMGRDLFRKCVKGVKPALAPGGQFLFTYMRQDAPINQKFEGWSYPNIIPYRDAEVASFLEEAGLVTTFLSPSIVWCGQSWAIGRYMK